MLVSPSIGYISYPWPWADRCSMLASPPPPKPPRNGAHTRARASRGLGKPGDHSLLAVYQNTSVRDKAETPPRSFLTSAIIEAWKLGEGSGAKYWPPMIELSLGLDGMTRSIVGSWTFEAAGYTNYWIRTTAPQLRAARCSKQIGVRLVQVPRSTTRTVPKCRLHLPSSGPIISMIAWPLRRTFIEHIRASAFRPLRSLSILSIHYCRHYRDHVRDVAVRMTAYWHIS